MTTPNTAGHSAIDQPGPARAGHGTAWTSWADLTWARRCPPWMHADGLSSSQRLLLAMVLFGPVTYRQAADQTGLTPAQVSRLCASPCDSWPWQDTQLTGRSGHDWSR